MPVPLLIVLLCMFSAFATVGLTFFRKGRHTLAWFMTLAPFVIMAGLLIAFQLGAISSLITLDSALYAWMSSISAVLGVAALLLFGCSLGAHRRRIPMWHQKDDRPNEIVTWGAYGYVRHPFYASYYLFMTACALAAPSYTVLITAGYCLIILNATAALEERELLSVFGAEYAELMQRTGRFFPRLLSRSRS